MSLAVNKARADSNKRSEHTISTSVSTMYELVLFKGCNHITHAGAVLKSSLRDFFLPACVDTRNSQDLEKSACSRDPKTDKARGKPKELSTDISALVPYNILENLIYARVEPIINTLFPKEHAGFRRGSQPWIKWFC